MFDVGVFGSPFRSNGSSFAELLFGIINGEDKLVLEVNVVMHPEHCVALSNQSVVDVQRIMH